MYRRSKAFWVKTRTHRDKAANKLALVAKYATEEGEEDNSCIELAGSHFTHREKGISCWPAVNATTRHIFYI